MQNLKNNRIDFLLLFFVIGLFLFLFASNVMLLRDQAEIRKVYGAMLDRKPTKAEIAFWIGRRAQRVVIEDSLSVSSERKMLVEEIFQDSLERDVEAEEGELYKKDALEDVARQLYRSKERMDAIRMAYLDMVGRPTNKDELFFHIESRTSIPSLRDKLNASEERRVAIVKTYKELAKREPSVEEVESAMQNKTRIVEIRVFLENQYD